MTLEQHRCNTDVGYSIDVVMKLDTAYDGSVDAQAASLGVSRGANR